jgi:uncharacterized protein YjbI with pentapeptide repeats
MIYDDPTLSALRARWNKPLLDPVTRAETVRDGCSTYRELLRLTLDANRSLLLDNDELVHEGADWVQLRPRLRSRWGTEAESRFRETMEALATHGLEKVVNIEASRYETRDAMDLRGSDCRDAVLCGASLSNAHFEGADLRGARIDGALCFETHFEHARCERASFQGIDGHFADFAEASCDHASFAGADCSMVSFERSRLRHADFRGAKGFATRFNGAYLHGAAIENLKINHHSEFGTPGELVEARRTKRMAKHHRDEEDGFIAELFPHWLRAAEVNSAIRTLLKSSGYFVQADDYQYQEQVCRRHATSRDALVTFFDWFFKDLVFGYGLKWRRPFLTLLSILLLWSLFFSIFFFSTNQRSLGQAVGQGIYYSVISLTTLGLGDPAEIPGLLPKVLVCTEALLGTVLMPLFLLAYARKILQD